MKSGWKGKGYCATERTDWSEGQRLGLGTTQLKAQSEGSGSRVAPFAVEVFAPAGFFLPLRVVYVCVCVRAVWEGEGWKELGRGQVWPAGSGKCALDQVSIKV